MTLTVNIVPFSVAELEGGLWRLEHGRDGPPAVVHREGQGAVEHLQDEVVPAALDGQQDAGDVPGLDLHGHVEVQPDPELPLREDGAAGGADEDAGLDLVGAGHYTGLVVAAPLAHELVAQSEVPQATHKAIFHPLKKRERKSKQHLILWFHLEILEGPANSEG